MGWMGREQLAVKKRALSSTDLILARTKPRARGPMAVLQPKQQDLRERVSRKCASA